jgi:transcriptional regulator NrdR family protein
MRPLNRPMFRYGGPIKEGVMDGIREPKKNGGRMLLAGEHPKQFKDASGREQHFVPLVGIGAAAMRFLPAAYRGFRAARAYTPMSQKLGTFGRIKDIFTPKGGLKISGGKAGEGAGFRVGSFLGQNPITTASLLPQAGALGYSAAKGTLSAIPGLAKGYVDAIIPGPSIFGDVDKEVLENIDAPSGKTTKELGTSETEKKSKVPGVVDTKTETKADKIKRYRDIMDIKSMNKDAAYNSLIAASQAVSDSGDFKGDLKSGRLINEIIQATSKQFDKPKQTKDAIDTLILKGEIEKDIKASDPSNEILNRLREVDIKTKMKALEGPDFAENKAIMTKSGGTGQSGIDGAASLTSEDFRGNLVTKTDISDVIEIKKKEGELDERTIVISYTNGLLANQKDGIADGDYTVGEYLVTVKDNKVFDITR